MSASLENLAEAVTGGGVLYSDKFARRYSDSSSGLTAAERMQRIRVRSNPERMNDSDKRIYNSLGDTSGSKGKMTFSELELDRRWQKRGIMFKSGPEPSWYTRWKKRVFVLKGNFLYYLPTGKKLQNAPVLGAIYLKNAIVEKTSLPFAKRVLSISPPVPRRKGWHNDETSVFHIRFRTEEGRDEWFEELQQVSFDHKYPAKKEPTVTNSMKFRHETPTKPKDRRSWTDSLF